MGNIEVGEIFTITDENDEELEVEVLAALNLEGTRLRCSRFCGRSSRRN